MKCGIKQCVLGLSVGLGAMAASTSVMAQNAMTRSSSSHTAAAHSHSAGSEDRLEIGLGVGFGPKYSGSRTTQIGVGPMIKYQKGMFFIDSIGAPLSTGIQTKLSDTLTTGVFLGIVGGRDARERLSGLRDIKTHANYGAFLHWAPGAFALDLDLMQAAKKGYGHSIGLNASYGVFETPQHAFRLGVGTVWASDGDMRTNFGVNQRESRRSKHGLKAYKPSAGFKNATAYASWRFKLDKHWSTTTVVGVQTLLADARNSPITERKTSAYGGVGVSYRF